MPRKSKRKSSSLVAPFPLRGRGRPRKFTAPDMFVPFGKYEVTTVEKYGSIAKNLPPVAEKPKKPKVNPATGDRIYSADEVEFMNALAEFKRTSGRTFPSCSEILGVLRRLGYEKVHKE